MSARSFRSVFMVASCAGAALGCYLVSLRVAAERAALENVETRIVLAQRDIRLLQTEIGTRGRLAQLERWNVKVLALSAPTADQFLEGGFALAKLVAPRDKVDLDAPVVLAAAPADGPGPQLEGRQPPPQPEIEGAAAGDLLHTASLKRKAELTDGKEIAAPRPRPAAAKPDAEKDEGKAATATNAPAKSASAKAPSAKARPAPAKSRPPATAKAKPAASDSLAPLGPAARPKALAATRGGKDSRDGRDAKDGKDSGSNQ